MEIRFLRSHCSTYKSITLPRLQDIHLAGRYRGVEQSVNTAAGAAAYLTPSPPYADVVPDCMTFLGTSEVQTSYGSGEWSKHVYL